MSKIVTIRVDGREFEAVYCGKGQYSKVYRVGDRVIYYTRGDCAKEVLAQFMYDRLMHIPEMIRHENLTMPGGKIWYVFSSPYYRDATTKDQSAYMLMKDIIKYFNKMYYMYYRQGYRGIDLMRIFVGGMEADKLFPRSVIKAMNALVDVSYNCGYDNVIFDIHKKNFGVNRYGVLMFRDIVAVQQRS